MQDLYIPKTKNSPMIQLDNTRGVITIKGSSIPEDAVSFYNPLLESVKEYCQNPRKTIVNMDLPYFNSSTSRIFHTLFNKLSEIHSKGFEVVVNWYYDVEDEDFKDAANVYATLSKIPFSLVERS
jgi:hypothetical protein